MDRFIHNENLKLWRKHLAETTDPQERAVLLNLISDEEHRESASGAGATKVSDRGGHRA